DAHFIEVLSKRKNINTVIINRPITPLEIFFKKKRSKISGEILLKKGKCTLYQIEKNMYLIDYISYRMIGHFIKKYKWYIDAYGSDTYTSFVKESLSMLEMNNYHTFSQNIFAYKLINKTKS